MTKPRIVVAPSLPTDVFQSLGSRFQAVGGDANMSVAEALQAARDTEAEGLLVSHRHKMSREVIAEIPKSVRVLATVTVGYDHIDVPAAKAHGLVVTNTPDVLTDCTADMAMLLILAASRRAAEGEQLMRKGWRQSFGMGEFLGRSVSHKRLGVFGMGRIGQALAQRARGFAMSVAYCNRSRLPPEKELGARYYANLAEMLPNIDILSIHAPATPETDRVIDRKMLALMPKGSVLVNTARGQLVDEDALIEALRSGQLFAAGLDVFRQEPDFDLRFVELPNVFLAPHIGSATVETRNAMGFRALDNIAAVCSGAPAIDPL
jgi:lactate dehydrogenase-like 2-hydroxyacid dehydrogenase